jgi:predicted transcriptional regulator
MASDDYGVTLEEFAKGKSQPQLAELFGVTQSAVSQMVNSKRNIRVRALADGSYQAFEIRPIGPRSRAA